MKMSSLFRKPNIYLFFLVIVIVGYLAVALVSSSSSTSTVPPNFEEARMEGALIAQTIVELSNRSIDDLKNINDRDRAGDFPGAMELINETINRSSEIREQAIKLSGELEIMTRSLVEVGSFGARQAALEAISNHLVLISRLINYSGYLRELLEVLRRRFNGDFSDGDQVPEIIKRINLEIVEINKLNDRAREAILRFDKAVR